MSYKYPTKTTEAQAQNTAKNYVRVKALLLEALREHLPNDAIKKVATDSDHSYEVVRRWFGDASHRPEISKAALHILTEVRREQKEVEAAVQNSNQ